MEINKVTTWTQLKQLAVLAEQYSVEDKQYDAHFAVYAIQLARYWQLPNFELYLLTDGDAPIGYTILHSDATMLNNKIYAIDLYVTKAARGLGAFKLLIKTIDDVAKKAGIPSVEIVTKLTADTWARLTGHVATSKTSVIISRQEAT